MNLYKETMRGVDKGIESDGRWIFCESAIVAENEDGEKRGRIKVVIPSIDPDFTFDDWVVPAATHCLGDGYGMLMIPPKGAEVLITGVLGQKFNLAYHSAVYNEDSKVPEELGIDTPGMKVPANLAFIANLIALFQGQDVQIIAEELAIVLAKNITAEAEELAELKGETVEVTATGEVKISGGTARIESDGSITVTGESLTMTATGNIAVNASGNLTLQGRIVNKVGPAI